MVWPDDDDPLFRQVWARCCAVYEGKNEDPTRGAVYYANLDTMTSSWFKENIVNKPSVHPMMVKIGRHSFFK
jgi:spore germination cell wall hydrolase CwlJ-like protein